LFMCINEVGNNSSTQRHTFIFIEQSLIKILDKLS
jgi:hypothetical protein